MEWLEEVEKRWTALPNDLAIREFLLRHIPLDPKNPKGPCATRVDCYSLSDPKKKPLFHIHVNKEDPDCNPKWKEVIEFYAQLHKDMGRLIEEVKGKKNEH